MDKGIPERFLATSQGYNPDTDESAMLCIRDIQVVLAGYEFVEEEDEQQPKSTLYAQMPIIFDTMKQLQKRVAVMSEKYNPPTSDQGLPLPQQFVYSKYHSSQLDTNLEGLSALELYYSDIATISIFNAHKSRDVLALCLLYTTQEVFDKMNLCREGGSMRVLKLESHGTINTAIIRHCVFLAHAYQIKYDVLQYTWDRQRMINNTTSSQKRERANKPRKFSISEQAKAYAIIDQLQKYASGHPSSHQLEQHLKNRKALDDASNEDLLSGKVSTDGVRLSPKGKYRIIEVIRGGATVRIVVDNRRTSKSRQAAT